MNENKMPLKTLRRLSYIPLGVVATPLIIYPGACTFKAIEYQNDRFPETNVVDAFSESAGVSLAVWKMGVGSVLAVSNTIGCFKTPEELPRSYDKIPDPYAYGSCLEASIYEFGLDLKHAWTSNDDQNARLEYEVDHPAFNLNEQTLEV